MPHSAHPDPSVTSQPPGAAAAAESTEFHPDRTHVLAAVVMLLIMFIPVAYKPLYLGWILLLPVLFIVVVLRSATIVDSQGITIRQAFRQPFSAPWERIRGIEFRGAKAQLKLNDDSLHRLPGVSFNTLPRLQAASQGRIPDPVGAAQAAAHDKVEVVTRDGRRILREKPTTPQE